MGVAISGIVLVAIGVFVATASKAGVGWALVASLASGVAFGIPVSIMWAWQRGHPSQDPTPFVPPSSPSLTESVAVRPILVLRPTPSQVGNAGLLRDSRWWSHRDRGPRLDY